MGGSSPGSDTGSAPVTPPESQSPLHFLADLAEQKSREEKKGTNHLKCFYTMSFYPKNYSDSLLSVIHNRK